MTSKDNSDVKAHIEQTARSALEQREQELPDDIGSALASARKKALDYAAQLEESQTRPTAKIYSFERSKLIWTGAIAASVTALALTLALQQPGTDLPMEADYLLSLAELESLDDTEWQLVQDLEFALWLSQEGLSQEGLNILDENSFEPQS